MATKQKTAKKKVTKKRVRKPKENSRTHKKFEEVISQQYETHEEDGTPIPEHLRHLPPNHMARKVGRPTKYNPIYVEWLIEHLAKGKSYETFPATVYRKTNKDILISLRVMYEWEKRYPEFMQAKESSVLIGREEWENIGSAMTTGSLRRVKSEKLVKDKNGNPTTVKDYEHTPGCYQAWKMIMKNRFGYQESIKVDSLNTNLNRSMDNMSLEDIDKELKALRSLNDGEMD